MGFPTNTWRAAQPTPIPNLLSPLPRLEYKPSVDYMRILLSRSSGGTKALFPPLRRAITVAADWRNSCHVRRRESVVVIMGATGTGKSKLSIDLASRFPSEVVNADKIQLYGGLDITTNKIPVDERHGVPHHLLGELDPTDGELPPSAFRSLASLAITAISARGRVPMIAGGSNSLLHALMADRFHPGSDPFSGPALSRSYRFRYRCCLLWVDVEAATLADHLDRRVDEMVGLGMVDELERYFASEGDGVIERHRGLAKAIGVPEFRELFTRGEGTKVAALAAIKGNTRRLAEEQVRKIKRLGEVGWVMRRVDATSAVRARTRKEKMEEGEAWERDVLGPAVDAVRSFLNEGEEEGRSTMLPIAVSG